MAEHQRLILHNFLSPDICKELEFIHKSCCTVGYRPNVFSTTLSHLISTNSAHLIMPFVPIRERLKEKVEEYFGCEYELFVEFTGLISWCKGASIGWHSDDNRDHLKQRDFSDVIIYTADDKNVHSVSEITEGERITLAMWFSRDASHDEDAKLLKALSDCSLTSHMGSISSHFPKLASNNMYWFPPEEASRFHSGFNICSARLHVLGFDIYFSEKERHLSEKDSSYNIFELLEEPLHLACGDELLVWEFVNILHALQVVQFYYWNASALEIADLKGPSLDTVPLSKLQRKKINCTKAVLLKDVRLVETLVGATIDRSSRTSFDRFAFSAVVSEWEGYTLKLLNELVMSMPYWRTHQSIFSVANLT